jgi:hypothetical protein
MKANGHFCFDIEELFAIYFRQFSAIFYWLRTAKTVWLHYFPAIPGWFSRVGSVG